MSTSYVQYPAKGVPIYSTLAAFPSPGPSGSLAVAADTDILYVSNGTVWEALASPGASPAAIDGLTGDVTASGPGVVPATLATVNSNVGSFTNANITVNGKGLVTAASNGSASPTPSVNHQIYVSQSGNDSTGDGSYNKPYLTVAKALTAVGATSNTVRYTINIGPGRFTEAALVIPSGVAILGTGKANTAILMSGSNNISLSATYGAGSTTANTSLFKDLTIQHAGGGTGVLDCDFTVSSSGLALLILALYGVNISIPTTAVGRTGFSDALLYDNGSLSGAVTASGAIDLQVSNSQIAAGITQTCNTTGDSPQLSFYNCSIVASISFDISAGSSLTGGVELLASPMESGNTLSVNGGSNSVLLNFDLISLPARPNLTLGTGITFAPVSNALDVDLVQGSMASSGNLTLSSTGNATKGFVLTNDGSIPFVDADPTELFEGSNSYTQLLAAQGSTPSWILAGTSATNDGIGPLVAAIATDGFSPAEINWTWARGTWAAPDFAQAGDGIQAGSVYVYDGTNYSGARVGQTAFVATETHNSSPGAFGTNFWVRVIQTGTGNFIKGLVVDALGIILPGFVQQAQITTPTNPPSGSDNLYFKSDDGLYSLNSSGVEVKYATETTPTANHLVYVTQTGNDISGDGSYSNPFATVSHALTTIPSNLANSQSYAIVLGPEQITDPNPILLKGYTQIWGYGGRGRVSRLSAPSFDFDSSIYSGTSGTNPSVGLFNLQLNGNWTSDFTGTTPNSAIVFFLMRNCTLNSMNITMTDPLNVLQCELNEVDFIASNTLTINGGLQAYVTNCGAGALGNFVFTDDNTAITSGFTLSSTSYASLTVTGSNAGSTLTVIAVGSNPTLSQTLSAVGSATLYYDNMSLAAGSAIVTYSNTGVTTTALQEALSLFYEPSQPGNWPLGAPNNVKTALDQLAIEAAPSVTNPGAYPYTTLETDKIVQVDTTSARTINPTTGTAIIGQVLYIKDHTGNAAANNVTVTPTSGTIDGMASATITQNYGVLRLYSDGSNWFSL